MIILWSDEDYRGPSHLISPIPTYNEHNICVVKYNNLNPLGTYGPLKLKTIE